MKKQSEGINIMDKETQIKFAEDFKKMHSKKDPLILPNAWDVASAVIFEKTGFKAVGTTSAGVSHSLGYSDGQKITKKESLYLVEKIVKRINIPLTVDYEGGYGTTANEIATNVRELIQTGAIGINFEDSTAESVTSLTSIAVQTNKLKAISSIKDDLGIDFFINARTDVYWLSIGDSDKQFQETIDRANAYIGAGADGIFIPGNLTKDILKDLVKAIDAPLNVLPSKTNYSIDDLKNLGVKRMSLGSGPVRSSIALIKDISEELYTKKTLNTMFNTTIPYEEANKLFE